MEAQDLSFWICTSGDRQTELPSQFCPAPDARSAVRSLSLGACMLPPEPVSSGGKNATNKCRFLSIGPQGCAFGAIQWHLVRFCNRLPFSVRPSIAQGYLSSRGHLFRSPEHRPRDLLSTGARLSSTGSEFHPARLGGPSFGSCLACRPRRSPNFPPRPSRRCSD